MRNGLVVAAALMTLLSSLAVAGEDGSTSAPKQVLILESFGREIAPWNAITPAFKAELVRQLQTPIEYHETPVETAREESQHAELAFAEYLRALYARRPPDLIVPVGAASAQFWWRHRHSLFPATPVVIGGIEDRLLKAVTLNSNDTAIAVQFDLPGGLDLILRVLPATTNVAVVTGNSRLERFWMAECQRSWAPFSNRVHFTWFGTLPFPEMRRRATTLPPQSVLAYGMVWVDAAGVPYEQMRALDQICAVANAPVFGLFEAQLGHGIVGGRLFSGAAVGRETARVAARVLSGEPAGQIPPLVLTVGRPMFDWRQLQRWNIAEQQIPPDSIVRFRQASAWERYRSYIAGAFGIMLLQAVTIVALLMQRARRRQAEAASLENLVARHEAELATQRQRNQLRHLGRVHVLGQLSTALAHELNQPLGAILSNAEAAELLLQKPTPPWDEVRDILADIRKDDEHASEVIRRVRGFLRRHEMELKSLSPEDLIAESIALARPDAVERKVSVESQVAPGTPRVRADRVHLEQVLLNLLVNALDAMRDCPAEQRRLLIRAEPGAEDTVLFSVEDAGPGLPTDQLERVFDSFHTTKPNGLGMGLSISRAIIEAHHGRIWAEDKPDGGAVFRFTLPKASGGSLAASDEGKQ